jgi:hypothetical protein
MVVQAHNLRSRLGANSDSLESPHLPWSTPVKNFSPVV